LDSLVKLYNLKHEEIQGQKLRVRGGGKFELNDAFIDLHNHNAVQAKKALRGRLGDIELKISKDAIKPNMGDGVNHVLKVVTGKGDHSPFEAVLRRVIPIFLSKDLGYQICDQTSKGVILVRIKKPNS